MTTLDRIRPGDLADDQRRQMERILSDEVDYPRLVGGGESIEVPRPIFDLLRDVLGAMRQGRTVLLLPEDEEVTTQQAATMLGVSRTHVIQEIEAGRLRCRLVGTHRRISLRALTEYRRERDAARRTRLDELFDGIAEDGAYE